MQAYTSDPASVQGKPLDIEEHLPLLIIGAGPAGLAAAIEAANLGMKTVLVDENPIPYATMGEDIPLHFGQRASAAAQSRNSMMQAILDNTPAMTAAYDAGVDLRLGLTAWGLYANGPSVAWLPGLVVGLTDGERAWLARCNRVIVAAGRRDMGLAFEGWEHAGVMGMTAAHRLAVQYHALSARQAVVLGSTAEALSTALTLHEQGTRIAAVLECGPRIAGHPEQVQALQKLGVPLLTHRTIERAIGGQDGIESVLTCAVDETGARVSGERPQGWATPSPPPKGVKKPWGDPAVSREQIAFSCDTIVLGIAAIPAIELLEAASCKIVFDPARGGFIPELDANQQCSISGVYAAGDCAGIWPAKSLDDAIAAQEGRAAARAIAASLNAVAPLNAETSFDTAASLDAAASLDTVVPLNTVVSLDAATTGAGKPASTIAVPLSNAIPNITEYRINWIRGTVLQASNPPHVCRCEEVTAQDILEVKPPRYLSWTPAVCSTSTHAARDKLGDAAPHPDHIKRLTRAGMGVCQGRRCREQIQALIALDAGLALQHVALASYRPPVRPLPLHLMAQCVEDPAISAHWDTWFGMPMQYLPPWEIAPTYTANNRDTAKQGASE